MKRTLALLASISLTGCASLIPGAEKVKFTDEAKNVAACKLVGDPVPYSWAPGAAKEGNVRDYAVSHGGDTVLVRHLGAGAKVGIVYNCTGIDLRQPVPVSQ